MKTIIFSLFLMCVFVLNAQNKTVVPNVKISPEKKAEYEKMAKDLSVNVDTTFKRLSDEQVAQINKLKYAAFAETHSYNHKIDSLQNVIQFMRRNVRTIETEKESKIMEIINPKEDEMKLYNEMIKRDREYKMMSQRKENRMQGGRPIGDDDSKE